MKQIIITYRQTIQESYFHALLRSFYPGCAIRFLQEGGQDQEKKKKEERSAEKAEADEPLYFLIVREEKGEALFSAWEREKTFEKTCPLTCEGKRQEEEFKNFIYECLCEFTEKSLPWGSLMGVRPTKLGRRWLRAEEKDLQQMTEAEEKSLHGSIAERYQSSYHASEKKAKLAADIAIREEKLIRRLDPEKGFSLYVGVPFCPTRCLYCSFTSNPIAACKDLVEPALGAMIEEIRQSAGLMAHNRPDTVYIGGGTPTALSAHQLERLMGAIAESFDLSGVMEYTVEAGRADSITKDKLRVIKEMGAERISVNPQTMNPETLALIGRKGTPDEVKQAFVLAKEAGFDHINMDLILGLPGEGIREVRRTLSEVEALGPDSMTVHSLAVKRGSDLHRKITEEGIYVNGDCSDAMELAMESAERMGLLPYYLYRQKNMSGNQENVGFAKGGKFGLYNILIMEEVQSLIACGPGGISKRVKVQKEEADGVHITRCENVKELQSYIDRTGEMIQRKRELFETM